MKKIKEIKIVNQDQSTEVANIGADAINVDYDDTTVKAELDKLNTVDNVLELKLNKKPYYYNSVADMKADNKLKVGDMAITLGYYTANDGGAGEYLIRNKNINDVDDNGSILIIDNLVAELLPETYVKTQQFGGTDNEKLLNSYNYAVSKKLPLLINKKLNITEDIEFLSGSTTIYGSTSLTTLSSLDETIPCDIYLNGGNLTISRLCCTKFYNIGFCSTGKNSENKIILNSFHIVFNHCFFFGFDTALYTEANLPNRNWVGENRIEGCEFFKCKCGIDFTGTSDGFITNNIFLASCDTSMKGGYGGFNITNNHFYHQQETSIIYCFNTLFSDNYIQELTVNNETIPSIEFTGISVSINNNKLELNTAHNNTSPNAILYLNLSGGEVYINSLICFPKDVSQTSGNIYAIKLDSNKPIYVDSISNSKGLQGFILNGNTSYYQTRKLVNLNFLQKTPDVTFKGGSNGINFFTCNYGDNTFTYADIINTRGFYIAEWTDAHTQGQKIKFGNGTLSINDYASVRNLKVYVLVIQEYANNDANN